MRRLRENGILRAVFGGSALEAVLRVAPRDAFRVVVHQVIYPKFVLVRIVLLSVVGALMLRSINLAIRRRHWRDDGSLRPCIKPIQLTLVLRCTIVLLALGCCPSRLASADSGLSLGNASLDFGRVPLGATVTKTVTLRNESATALRIEKINWTCGCVQGELKDPLIAARAETKLLVRARPTKPGPLAGTLFLYDSDGQSHQIQVSVEGIPAISVKPDILRFGAVIQGVVSEKVLTIEFSETGTYVADRFVYDPDRFDVNQLAESSEQPVGSLRFNIRVNRRAPAGEFRESLVVYLRNEQELTACVVSLTGRITAELYTIPALLRIQIKPSSVAIKRSFILRSATGMDFEVVSLSSDTPALSAVVRIQRKGLAIIDVSVASNDPAELPRLANLLIETNVASPPKLIVPIELPQESERSD